MSHVSFNRFVLTLLTVIYYDFSCMCGKSILGTHMVLSGFVSKTRCDRVVSEPRFRNPKVYFRERVYG